MATTTDPERAPALAFDRLESLADPHELSRILGPVARLRREPLTGNTAGFSNSRHELLHVELADGGTQILRL